MLSLVSTKLYKQSLSLQTMQSGQKSTTLSFDKTIIRRSQRASLIKVGNVLESLWGTKENALKWL